MIINSFPKIVKDILRGLPKNDYPVLNSRLFFECWLSYALDNSLTSMRDLFNRLNNTGFEVDISTFSKANLHRSQKPFQEIYQKLNELVQKKVPKKLHDKYAICPIDSTIITLTSKLLWVLGHHQVKLFSSLNLATGSPSDNFINFGHDHDYKFGYKMMSSLAINAVGVMDR
nr:IS4 family transposase [Dendronalium phyllosphericum CENA369]